MNKTYHLGLVGWPLAHSLSPRLHRAALQACNLTGDYGLYPVDPAASRQAMLATLLERLRSGELDGLNVTIPHKQAVLPLLDGLTPTAQAIGAVNTLYLSDQQLVGDNTDALGFLTDLDLQFRLPPQGQALVFGAGGAARAVVYALGQRGWQVHLAARDRQTAQQVVADLSHLLSAPVALTRPLAETAQAMNGTPLGLVVNATPLGMQPNEQQSPWPEAIPLPPGSRVYDLVYHPHETQLLRQARKQGLPAANGLGMLVHQAALAFLQWTNLPAQQLPIILQAMHAAARSTGHENSL